MLLEMRFFCVVAMLACVCFGSVVLCVAMAVAMRVPVKALRKAGENGHLQAIHRAIVSKALRVAILHLRFVLAATTSTAVVCCVSGYFISSSLSQGISYLNDGSWFYIIAAAWVMNRFVNDLTIYVLAFSKAAFSVNPSGRDFDALEQLAAVGGIARRLLQGCDDAESFFIVGPGGETRYVSRVEPRPRPPDKSPSVPVWRIAEGDVRAATLERALNAPAGAWAWEDVQSANAEGMPDGKYKYVACFGEEFLRAAVVDSHNTLAGGATVLMAGTLEVRDGMLDLWTSTLGGM